MNNAATMLCLAFEMLEKVSEVMDPLTQKPIEMRIGIHTGSIIAGVWMKRTSPLCPQLAEVCAPCMCRCCVLQV
jgi:hypothetical protein